MDAELKKFMKNCRKYGDNFNFRKYLPRPSEVSFTIPVSSWTQDSAATNEFVYYTDINISGLTANDTAEIDFGRASRKIATAANISDTGETLSGVIRLFAEKIPSDSISGTATITKGVS